MANQLTSNVEALRLFFTEDIYLVKNEAEMIVENANENLILETTKIEINIIEEVVMPKPRINEVQDQELTRKELNFEYLGKNQKGILILVNDPVNKVSSTQGTELLRKLVKAIGLTNNDFALLNYSSYSDAKFVDLNTFFNCKLLLAFGVKPQSLDLAEHALHQLHNFESTRLIFTTNLHELANDQASKKILWATLQQLK